MSNAEAHSSKSVVYVGGFDQSINAEHLRNAFITFGPIVDISIPRNTVSEGGHRGFAFVEFKYVDDAKAAIDNMHMAELYGQVIKCNLARNYTLD